MAIQQLPENDRKQPNGMHYTGSDITVLEGLDPVRKRPGMYIGSTGPTGLHHLVWEVVDNSVDEAMAGFCTRIDVTMLADGGVPGVDDGRGIPVDRQPGAEATSRRPRSSSPVSTAAASSGESATRSRAACTAWASRSSMPCPGACCSTSTGTASTTGWSSPTAASRSPRSRSPARRRAGAPARRWRSGPTARIFEETEFRSQTIVERLQMYAFLNAGLEIRFVDERPEHGHETVVYKYAGGIIDFVRHLNQSKEALFKKVAYYNITEEDGEVEIALQWNTGYYEGIHGFANGIATGEGGMHDEGFKKALTNAVNKYARAKGFLKEKDENLLGEDIREGLTAIVSVKLRDPQFEGQTKAKLGNVPMRSLVERATNEKLAEWLEEHPTEARQIVRSRSTAARARLAAREARNATRRKSALEGAGMPEKLRDCARGTDPPTMPSCSSSRATRPAARPPRRATRRPRRSSRSGARS